MTTKRAATNGDTLMSFDDLMANFEIKMKIVDIMTELMKKTPIDDLSVDRICAAANISRTTFYRYFKDKYGVGQWHVQYCSSLGTAKIGRTLTWREGYYITEAAIAEHFEFYIYATRSNNYNGIDSFAPRMRRELLAETITQYKNRPLTEKLKFEIDATIRMETYLLPHWHYGDYDISLETACDWMASLVPHELFELLNTPVKLLRPAGRLGHPSSL